MITAHLRETGSPLAEEMLRDWSEVRGRFWQVCPIEMMDKLEHPLAEPGLSGGLRASIKT